MVYIGKGRMYSDGTPKPRFKRYYTGKGAGKGDDRRDTQVDERTMARNWCRTFGHHLDFNTLVCSDCGITHLEMLEAGESESQR